MVKEIKYWHGKERARKRKKWERETEKWRQRK